MKVAEFDYALPKNLIATHPGQPRESARLMHVKGLSHTHLTIADLPNQLQAGDMLVVNNTKVIPARLFGKRGELSVEVLLHRYMPNANKWEVFAKPTKRLKLGQIIHFNSGLEAEVLHKNENGTIHIAFNMPHQPMMDVLQTIGHLPLPPYIERDAEAEDALHYQTSYAKHEGSVAAPTAGLHLTESLREQLTHRGVEWVEITLHVGAGTFQPVKVEDTSEHVMHSEFVDISSEAAARINNRKGRLVAVGTTSLRSLESAADENGRIQPMLGDTDIFITPGYAFKTADMLLTNFHLPKSTLMMLISAFAGHDNVMKAYEVAIAKAYRFYSYGDACLLERESS